MYKADMLRRTRRSLVQQHRFGRAALVGFAALASLGACADVRPPSPDWARTSPRPSDEPGAISVATSSVVEDRVDETVTSERVTVSPPPSPAVSASEPSAPPPSVTHPYHAPVPHSGGDAPASRYAGLSERDCSKELARRDLPFGKSKVAAKGVSVPMRIEGPMHGVRFVAPGASSRFGIVDCRLALALDDFARVVADLGVVEVRIDNVFRPNAHLPGKKKASQHAHALAVDIVSLRTDGGRVLSLPGDWHAPIGSVSCGPEAVLESPSESSIELRNIVCEVARKGIFHHMLTPSFNAAHQSHFHFDIKRGAKRSVVR